MPERTVRLFCHSKYFQHRLKRKKKGRGRKKIKKAKIDFLFGEDVIHNVRRFRINFFTVVGNDTCSENKRNTTLLPSSHKLILDLFHALRREEHVCY